MSTVTELIQAHGVEVDEHLDREALVPVSSAMQRQGDVIVIPVGRATAESAKTQVPAEGVAVVRNEEGGNTHLLLADGDVRFNATTAGGDLTVGYLKVGEEATAYLAHAEHGFAGIAPGTYEVRRQREQAETIQLVAD